MPPAKKLTVLSLLLLVITFLLWAIHPRGSEVHSVGHILLGRVNNDSSTCMDIAWQAFKEGKPVYETVLFQHIAKFQYPMSSLLLYRAALPLGLWGEITIKILALASFPATLLLCGEIFLLAFPLKGSLSSRQRVLIRLSIALIGLLFYPLAQASALGQIQAFLILLWTLAVYFWMRGREDVSGLCIGIACIFKPQLAVFLLWAGLRRRWRFLLPMLGVVVATQIVTILLFGWHNEIEYLAVISYLSHHGEVYFPNQSVNGLVQRLLHTGDSLTFDPVGFPPYNSTVYRWTVVTSALLVGLGLFLPMVRRWRDSTLDFLFFGLVATVASPIAWEHHYGYFFTAGIYCMAVFFGRRDARLFGLESCFMLLAVSIPSLLPLANTRWSFVVSYEFFAGLGFLWAMALLASRSGVGTASLSDPVSGIATASAG
jgi:hypothetical protein